MLLLESLALLALAVCSTSARILLSSLVDTCEFVVDSTAYNLCPLFERRNNEWKVEFESHTPPTITKHIYRLSLDGKGLLKDGTLPDHEQCPDGTWVCMTTSNRRPDHRLEPPRIIQLVPVAAGDPAKVGTTARRNADDGALEVRLHGGSYVDQPQKARLQFTCDETVPEPSSPSFAWSWNGTHTFAWATRHACGTLVDSIEEPSDNDNGDRESDSPPADDGADQDLLGNLPNKSTSRTLVAVFLLTTPIIAIVAYLIYSPPHQLKQRLTAHLIEARQSKLPFRVGENVLIRWAEEDMGIEDEEDLMVNYREDHDSDEQIPLKPSPGRFSSRSMNYGTTRG